MMDYDFYLKEFQRIAKRLEIERFKKEKIEIKVEIVLESVCLKLYKKEWFGAPQKEKNEQARVFFSIWINEKTLQEQKISYNIHAFKLRKMQGYQIQSRLFAEKFRRKITDDLKQWENVNIDFGPLTLMEGWCTFDKKNLETILLELSNKFLNIDHLIDETFEEFKK